MEIADLIAESGFAGKVASKISCRSDEIDEEVMGRLMAGGLTHVYVGVESGDEEGLLNMSKRLKPEAHLKREEARLVNEVAQYYEWVHQDHGPVPGPAGGFDRSWTFYEGDREAAGVGAA